MGYAECVTKQGGEKKMGGTSKAHLEYRFLLLFWVFTTWDDPHIVSKHEQKT